MPEHKDFRLAAIMFTDIQGFSKKMEKDEKGTLELVHFHNDLLSRLVDEYHGTVIKTIGNAFMVTFNSTANAVLCAVQAKKHDSGSICTYQTFIKKHSQVLYVIHQLCRIQPDILYPEPAL